MGEVLYVPLGASLPPNCIKCGEPAQQEPWRKNFRYTPVMYPMILGLARQKNMEVNVPLCAAHFQRRKQMVKRGLALMLGSPLLGVLIGCLPGKVALEIAVFIGGVGLFTGIGIAMRGDNYLNPTVIDDYHGEFKGACQAFLRLLPQRAGF